MCKLNKFTATLYVNENTKKKGAEGIVWEHDSEMKPKYDLTEALKVIFLSLRELWWLPTVNYHNRRRYSISVHPKHFQHTVHHHTMILTLYLKD